MTTPRQICLPLLGSRTGGDCLPHWRLACTHSLAFLCIVSLRCRVLFVLLCLLCCVCLCCVCCCCVCCLFIVFYCDLLCYAVVIVVFFIVFCGCECVQAAWGRLTLSGLKTRPSKLVEGYCLQHLSLAIMYLSWCVYMYIYTYKLQTHIDECRSLSLSPFFCFVHPSN